MSLRDAREAPCLPQNFFFGHLLSRWRDPLGLYLRAAETLGDFTRFRFFDKNLFLVTSAEGIARVLHDNAHNYVKGFGYAAMKAVMGDGLVTSDGETWAEQHRRVRPAFQAERMASLRRSLQLAVQDAVSRWPANGGPLDAFSASLALSRSVAGSTLFGVDHGSEVLESAVPFLQREVSRRSLALWPRPPWRASIDRTFETAVRDLDTFIHGVLERRRRLTSPPDDFLQQLVTAWPEPESRKQLRDTVVTLFLAAYETTATALTWTLALLSRHPKVAERVHAEVRSQPADRLGYTRQVVDEGLRLYPPVWLFARRASCDDVVGGYRVPAGSYVLVSPWVNHRLSRLWPEPEVFDPDRFAPEARRRVPRFAFFPFSSGPRTCIGAGFATWQLIAAVAAIVSRYRLEMNGPLPGFDPLVTLQPRGEVRLWLTSRKG